MGGRKARQSFTYRAFVPDPIAAIQPVVSFETARLINEAETAVGQLNSDERVGGLEAIGALLLRSEAIASSRIEGIELSQRNLARALIDPRAAKGTARAVAANVVAMEQAIAIGDGESELTTADILTIHRTLMAHEPARVMPGAFRGEQNWIGGRLQNPSDARYVPPPEDRVEPLMLDLVEFVNRDDLPAVPRRRSPTPSSRPRRAGRPRRDSAAARIIAVLPAQPITSAATMRAAIGARHQRALEGLKVLADAGVLRQVSEGGYDRQYAADELFELIEEYEQRAASA